MICFFRYFIDMNTFSRYGLLILSIYLLSACAHKTNQRKPGKNSSVKITGLRKVKTPTNSKSSSEYFVKQAEEIIEKSKKEEKERIKAQKKQAELGYEQEKENAVAAEKESKKPRKINTGEFNFY